MAHWDVIEVTEAYFYIRYFLKMLLAIFFQDFDVVGKEDNFPIRGPVILVGNHQNQFVDPTALIATCPRKIGFLMAEKSFTKPVVGAFARWLSAIPVVRAQDRARRPHGTLSAAGARVTGSGTAFTSELAVGETLNLPGASVQPRIATIDDDATLTVTPALDDGEQLKNVSEWKVYPKIDQSEVYTAVYERLSAGGCVGIFPEGGSHDQTRLLPLKPGVAVMALGFLAKHPDADLTIVPCGLNYFSGHRFRSDMVIEYGKGIKVPAELQELAKSDKRKAGTALLALIQEALNGVTINTPDYETLRIIHLIRRMYQPRNVEINTEQYMTLNRRFAEGYLKVRHQPRVKALAAALLAYQHKLSAIGMTDRQLSLSTPMTKRAMAWQLLRKLLWLLACVAGVLPGLLPNVLAMLAARAHARRQAAVALAGSTVKVAGRDVIASAKIVDALVLIPLSWVIYVVAVAATSGVALAVLTLVTLPTLSAASLLAFDEARLTVYALRPLVVSLTGGIDQYQRLREHRTRLVAQVRAAVEEMGPAFDWWKAGGRIFTRQEIELDQKLSEIEGTPAGADLDQHNADAGGVHRRLSYKKTADLSIDFDILV